MKLKHINLLSFAALAGCALALAGCGGSGISGTGMNSAMKDQAVVGDTAAKGYTGKPMPPIQVPVTGEAKGGKNEAMWHDFNPVPFNFR